MAQRFSLIAVVPSESSIPKMLARASAKWRLVFDAGRTYTMARDYDAVEHAMADGRALDRHVATLEKRHGVRPRVVWGVEPAAP